MIKRIREYEYESEEYTVVIDYAAITACDSDERGPFVELEEIVYIDITYIDSDGDEHPVTSDELEDLIGWKAVEDIEFGLEAQIMEEL